MMMMMMIAIILLSFILEGSYKDGGQMWRVRDMSGTKVCDVKFIKNFLKVKKNSDRNLGPVLRDVEGVDTYTHTQSCYGP